MILLISRSKFESWVRKVLLISIVSLLFSNSVNTRREKSMLYSRLTIIILLFTISIFYDILSFKFLSKGIGIYQGLLHVNSVTIVFDIFICILSACILTLTSFKPHKILLDIKERNLKINLLNKLINLSEQFRIIEYPLIILFIVIGAIFLMSSNDLVTMFLSIELQSYGLYLLSTLYRNSELSTSGGLTYFLLGGLSSCLILLSTCLIYANSGTTSLDNLYVITNISETYPSRIFLFYQPNYIEYSLIIMGVGFLFKVSAAPFHFWSPDRWSGKSSIALSSCIRDKLPNSGNALELKVPTHSWKAAGGWTNYSCMATTLKTSEKKVGNRGSKSVTGLYFLLGFAQYLSNSFLCLINSFFYYSYVLHFSVVLLSKHSLFTILSLLIKSLYLYPVNFSAPAAISVDVEHNRTDVRSLPRRATPLVEGLRGYSTKSSPPPIKPVKIYKNADLNKLLILKESKGKCGIYRWTNISTGKSYIGSSVDLERRFRCYFNIYFLESGIKIRKSLIYNSLLKYGYSNFTLEVLEYCTPSKAIAREQFYLDLFKPKYNILTKAGSRLGSKHSEETIAKISASAVGNKNGKGGKGRKRAEGAGSPSVPVEVLDQETGQNTIYPSMREVGIALGVPTGSISMYFYRNTQKPYKGRYLLQKIADP